MKGNTHYECRTSFGFSFFSYFLSKYWNKKPTNHHFPLRTDVFLLNSSETALCYGEDLRQRLAGNGAEYVQFTHQ